MSSLLRCTACAKEMVLEAFHAGRRVPCPWCRAANDVPQAIDFASLAKAQVADESRGGTLLVLAVLSFLFFCIPASAWIWWLAHGAAARAAEEGRPSDAMVQVAKWIAIGACVLQGGIAALLVIARLG